MRMSLLLLFLLHFSVNAQEAKKAAASEKVITDTNVTEKATVFSLKKKINYTKGKIVNMHISNDKAGSILLFAFDKGQELGGHSVPFDAVIQIIEGKAKIEIAGKPFELKEGEAIILPANVIHAVYATEAFKMLLIKVRE